MTNGAPRALARVGAAILTLAASFAAARAQGEELTAEDAVQRALRRSPLVAQAEERVISQQSSVQSAEGTFDSLFAIDGGLDYGVEELVGSRLKSEVDRRLRFEIPPPFLDKAAQKLVDGIPIDASLLFPSSCQDATNFILVGTGGTLLCTDDDGNLLGLVSSEFAIDPSLFGAVGLAQAFVGIAGLDERVQVFIDLLQATGADVLRQVAFVLRRTADSLRFQRILLGDVPTDRESIRFDLGFDHQHRFRNGSALVSSFSLSSTEENFRGKALDPVHGDSLIPNVFRLGAGIALDLPLGRGGGRVAFEAPYLASSKGLDATRALLAQVASERALAALEAYWDVAAAQRRVELLEQSREIQQGLYDAAQQLADADLVARVDLERNRARLSDVEASVAGARQALEVARASLVRTIGLDADELAAGISTPSGFDAWIDAEPIDSVEASSLAERALTGRDDVRAAESTVEANQILADAARSNLRPEVALSLNASYNAFHETYQDRFFDPAGFEEAARSTVAGPSYGVTLRVRFPIGNNVARGRLLQAESATASSAIDAAELQRSIRLNVIELVASVRRARSELAARREALEQIEATQAATVERFRVGDLTVLDTLTTESQLTGARLDVLAAERALVSLLARLRFESGALIELAPGQPAAEAKLVAFGSPIS